MTHPTIDPDLEELLRARLRHVAEQAPTSDSETVLETIAAQQTRRPWRAALLGSAAAAALVVGWLSVAARDATPPPPDRYTVGGPVDVLFPTMPEADGGYLTRGYGAALQVTSSGCPYIEVDQPSGLWPAGTYVLHVLEQEEVSLHRTSQGWQVRDSTGRVIAKVGQGLMTRPLPRADPSGLKHAGACSSLIDNGALTAHVGDFAPPAGASAGFKPRPSPVQ